MSYLEDPRVFLATERTLLAWIRTEISILAIAFLLKKFGLEEASAQADKVNSVIAILCYTTILLSVLAWVQSWISISKLGAIEIPGPLAKPLVMIGGFVSIVLSAGATYIVMSF